MWLTLTISSCSTKALALNVYLPQYHDALEGCGNSRLLHIGLIILRHQRDGISGENASCEASDGVIY
jgi:hypothetical protein